MKRIYLFLTIVTVLPLMLNAQNKKIVGAGYFGNTATYPGLVFEYEFNMVQSEKASLPFRINTGFYVHKRYNAGVFADLGFGLRRQFNSGVFLEQFVGVGVLTTFLNSDAVYSVDDKGNVTEASRYAATDFMPSLTLGIGYNLSRNPEKIKLLWLRPKIFWQYPHKTSSLYTPAVQIGYSFSP